MKSFSFIPWMCAITATSSTLAYALDGVNAYRQGHYFQAMQGLNSNQDPMGLYYLGQMRLYGYGELKNNRLALSYFEKAGEKGALASQEFLARFSLTEAKSPEKALYWFRKAAAQGSLSAQKYCAAAYLYGYGTKKNTDLARRYFIDAARRGDAISQYSLAETFLESRAPKSKKLGLIWLNKALEQNNPKALVKMAQFYMAGNLLKQDNVKAMELLNRAVSQDYAPALLMMGEIALKQNNAKDAKAWFTKAAAKKDGEAQFALATLYMTKNTPYYNPQKGFMWMLQAAKNGSLKAQGQVAVSYKTGEGVEADAALAEQWLKKSQDSAKQPAQSQAAIQMAQWLSNDKVQDLAATAYHLGGIYTSWENPLALKENNYNMPPQMPKVFRKELYKPQFTMIKPNEVAINDYFDVIAPELNASDTSRIVLPRYPLDAELEALQSTESLVLRKPLVFSLNDTGKYQINETIDALPDADKTKESALKERYQSILTRLYGQAILGESSAQFEIGQLYHYGVGVTKNIPQAITYYRLAAGQQDLRAEYNLGVLYLEGKTTPIDYEEGVNWLTDAAFKGNTFAQFVLASMYEKGFQTPEGQSIVSPDSQQAIALYSLAAAGDFAPAQYRLADYLVKHQPNKITVAAKAERVKLIKGLYQGAVKGGVKEARLALAFYDANDSDNKAKKQAFVTATEEAKAGNKNAALLLGIMYERGVSVAVNESEALYWYQQANQNPASSFILGTYYSEGKGLNKDLEKGRALLEQSAQANFSAANYNLAILNHDSAQDFLPELQRARQLGNSRAGLLLADYYLARGKDTENYREANAIYQEFADKGDKDAQLKLAYLYEHGLGGTKDFDTAAKWYELAANQNQPVAQYLLGHLYQLGHVGKTPDYAQAKHWYEQAQKNYPRAASSLGFLQETVEDAYSSAREQYEVASTQKEPNAQFNLALMYENGKGIPVDYNKAQDLYEQAAEAGHPQAMTQLAGIYFGGLAGSRDNTKAMHWYKKAAALHETNALYQLGLLSETGVATKLDFEEAKTYYQASADRGNEKAKLALARMYQYGLGVEKDLAKATLLYTELAANNNAFAQYQLALVNFDTHKNADEVKKLLQSASVNGSQQAEKALQWLEAQRQDRVSFIEPVVMNSTLVASGQAAERMYFEALNEWNRGDEPRSRLILNQIMTEFPHYAPAKRAYEQLQQPILSFSSAS